MLRRVRPALIGASLAAVLAVGSVAADPGTKVLDASMTGIPASAAGTMLAGVQGGGVPWVLDKGDAKLFADGRLEVRVRGLVFAAGANAGRNTVPFGRAIVSCNGGADVVLSGLVDYSPAGDATVSETLDLPDVCLAPVVFFAGQTGNGPRWFAVTGG